MGALEIRKIEGSFKGVAQVTTNWGNHPVIKVGGETLVVASDVARVEAEERTSESLSVGKLALRGGLMALAGASSRNHRAISGLADGLAGSFSTHNLQTVVTIGVFLKDGRAFMGNTTLEAYKMIAEVAPHFSDEEIGDLLKAQKRKAAMLDEADLLIPEFEEELEEMAQKRAELETEIGGAKKFERRFQLKEELEELVASMEEKTRELEELRLHAQGVSVKKPALEMLPDKRSRSLKSIMGWYILLPFVGLISSVALLGDSADKTRMAFCFVPFLFWLGAGVIMAVYSIMMKFLGLVLNKV